jgi:hypothetical protein
MTQTIQRPPEVAAERTRRDLSDTLRRILRERGRGASYGVRLRARRDAVADAYPDLDLLARRLGDSAPVESRGVTLTRRLLSDGTGPMFWSRSPDDLKARVREAIEALEPRDPVGSRREEPR